MLYQFVISEYKIILEYMNENIFFTFWHFSNILRRQINIFSSFLPLLVKEQNFISFLQNGGTNVLCFEILVLYAKLLQKAEISEALWKVFVSTIWN